MEDRDWPDAPAETLEAERKAWTERLSPLPPPPPLSAFHRIVVDEVVLQGLWRDLHDTKESLRRSMDLVERLMREVGR